jgi:hypothetical protein
MARNPIASRTNGKSVTVPGATPASSTTKRAVPRTNMPRIAEYASQKVRRRSGANSGFPAALKVSSEFTDSN